MREGPDYVPVLSCHSQRAPHVSLPILLSARVTGVRDWADSGDVRLRERHVRSAGVFATEHAEEFGQAHPNPATIDRTRVLVRKTRYGCWRF